MSQDYGRCRNELGEMIQKGEEKRKWRDQGREDDCHKIINNNLHIHTNVQKSLCQIEYLQMKILFKRYVLRHDLNADSESTFLS